MKKLLLFFYPFPNREIPVGRLLTSIKIYLAAFLVLVSTISFGQTFPSPSSCTSKDLILVKASVPVIACETCNPGDNISKLLTVAINNKTGSVRTSFAFWATYKILNADGTTYSTSSISGCFGPIPKNAITSFPYGNITYPCGKTLQLINIWEAWTTSNGNETCAFLQANTATINPKCGVEPLISIIAGVDANFDVTNATCTTLGSIKVKPYGGTPPYSVQLGSATPRSVPAGDSTTFSGLGTGSYSFTLKDANNCTVGVSRSRDVATTGSLATPAATVTQPNCSVATGTVNITSPVNGITYTLSQGGITKYTANGSGVFSSVIAGTYVLKASNGTCTTTGNDVTVNTQPATPDAPTVSVVNNCDGSSDLTASNYTGSLSWSTGATTASIHVTNAATYTVTQTSADGCISPSGSGTSAPRTAPGAPTVSVVNNCDGSSDLTASKYTGSL